LLKGEIEIINIFEFERMEAKAKIGEEGKIILDNLIEKDNKEINVV